MNLTTIVDRIVPPGPWVEGEKIPWDDAAFSRRMLAEHLSQAHDHASRRLEIIEQQVNWIHRAVLNGQPGRVLDLGCGPGLYLQALARRGCQGMGIDFSPASIAYARSTSTGLPLEYLLADVRDASFGGGYDLVMLIYGELNVFQPVHARALLQKAFAALKPGGRLLLEVSTFNSLQRAGGERSWFSASAGLFSDRPHIVLSESYWDEGQHVLIERYYVIDAQSASVNRMASSSQAYQDGEYRALCEEAGFREVAFHDHLDGKAGERGDFFPLTALKPTEGWL